MIIEKLSSLTIKVSLSHEEMADYMVDFDSLNENSSYTKNLIKHLINEIHHYLGINLRKENLYIEAFSSKTGCILYISANCQLINDQPENDINKTDYLILESGNEKNLIRFSEDLIRYFDEYCLQSSLYHYENTFRMIIKIFSVKKSSITDTAVTHSLKPYEGIENQAVTDEYFECIFEKDAAEILSGKILF